MPSTIVTQSNGSAAFTANPTIDRTQLQWLFTPVELLKSPSILEGMPASQETANRQKGVNFITQVGIMLKLPQLTLATASVFLHRFYMRHPMQVSKDKGIHHYQVAATALFLATKVEENCRKMRELIVACCRVAQKQPNLIVDDQSKEYWKWRDTILHNEDVLLETLCFDLQLEQPYRILFDFLCYYAVQEHKNLRNTSWAFLNDSHITTLCLLFPPRTIAGSALYAGAKMTGVTLPDDERGRPWWQHLELDIFDIQKTCNVMAEVYENPALPRQGPKEAYLKEDDIMTFDRTRHTQSPSIDMSPAYSQRSTSLGVKREREDSWGHEQRTTQADAAVSSVESGSGQAPSPKRQRTDSQSNGDNSKRPRIPDTAESRIPQSASGVKEEAQRIDESTDVAGAALTVPSDTNRRTSHPDILQTVRKANVSNDLAETVANGTGRGQPDQPNQHRSSRHAPPEPAAEHGYVRTTAINDDAEEVDYGSEEGEV